MTTTADVLDPADPQDFLGGDEIIDLANADVRALARSLRERCADPEEFARAAFTWVRDRVDHAADVHDRRVTLAAGEVLSERVGLCYAKSHLLTALLRAEGVPAGLCYQRLTHRDGHVLHGLIAVHLRGRWHRQDPRGNTGGIDARFSLGAEHLAFTVDPDLGEIDYSRLYAAPAAPVIAALRGATDLLALYESGLPTGL